MDQLLFDVAFSFSGKEREFVRSVKAYLEQHGLTVFMDEDYSITIWGHDLHKTFEYLYSGRAKYYVIFVSENYVKSLNTFFEFSAMLKNLYEKETSKILQILLDNTTLSFLPPIGAINICNYNSQKAGEKIVEKIQGESLNEIFRILTYSLDKGCNSLFPSKIEFFKNREGIYCYRNSLEPERCYKILIEYIHSDDFEKIFIYDSFVETGYTMTFPTGILQKNNYKVQFFNYGFCCENYQFEITASQLFQIINKKILLIG